MWRVLYFKLFIYQKEKILRKRFFLGIESNDVIGYLKPETACTLLTQAGQYLTTVYQSV